MEYIESIFNTSVRIDQLDPLDDNAIWSKNTEVCVTRVPIRKRDGYSAEMMKKFAEKLKANMVTNGIVFLICYAPSEDKARPFEVAKAMTDAGFSHIDNIIVKRSWLPGKRSEVNLVNSYDYVLYFCNGNVWKLDRTPLIQYLKTEEEVHCPGNCWTVETGSLDEAYSYDLAELLIRMTDSLPSSIIMDPFMGGTSSLKAALKLGHSFVGFDKDKVQTKKYEKIVKEHENKMKGKK